LDVVGVGTRMGDQTRIRFLGFSGQVGLSQDLPVMVLAFEISPAAGLGAQGSLEILESTLRLEAPGGTIYRNDVKQGSVTGSCETIRFWVGSLSELFAEVVFLADSRVGERSWDCVPCSGGRLRGAAGRLFPGCRGRWGAGQPVL
jgi:hypothetical protein